MRDGLWRSLRPLNSLQYFERVERVIRERTDRLEPTVLALLKAAAVIGRSFDVEALAILLELPTGDHSIERMLEALATCFGTCAMVKDTVSFVMTKFATLFMVHSDQVRQRLHDRLAHWFETNQLFGVRSRHRRPCATF